jgi:hypothetical protein
MKDPSYPPEERARKILALFAELTAVGLLTAVSFKASAKEATSLSAKPRYLKDEPRVNVPEERLQELVTPDKPWDATVPPVLEGHTKEIKQKTIVNTGIKPAPPKIVGPQETEFAKRYPKDDSKWQTRRLEKYTVQLIDHEGFGVLAEVDPQTLDMVISIETTRGTKAAGNFRGAKDLRADEVYPRIYQHFSEQGVNIQSVSGTFCFGNVSEAIPLYERRINEAIARNPALAGAEFEAAKAEAAREAITVVKTFKYHSAQGLKNIVYAKRDGNGFDFKITR